jgi:hypothetical protein
MSSGAASQLAPLARGQTLLAVPMPHKSSARGPGFAGELLGLTGEFGGVLGSSGRRGE